MILPNLRIAIIGGTGKEGRGIAFRWGAAGFSVIIGSRRLAKAQERAQYLNEILGDNRIGYAKNEDAVSIADIVVLTVPYDCAPDTLQLYGPHFRPNAILVDATVPLIGDDPMRYVESLEGSGSERLVPHIPPSVHLVAAFKTVSAYALFDPTTFGKGNSIPPLNCDDFVASDSEESRLIVIEAMRRIAGLRALDAGPLENARSIERLTVLIIALNRLNGVKTGRYKVIGF